MTMLTVSILWVVLAVAVTVTAMVRRSAGAVQEGAEVKESGNALAFLAVASSLVLLAGFVYVGHFFVAGL